MSLMCVMKKHTYYARDTEEAQLELKIQVEETLFFLIKIPATSIFLVLTK